MLKGTQSATAGTSPEMKESAATDVLLLRTSTSEVSMLLARNARSSRLGGRRNPFAPEVGERPDAEVWAHP
jgi:hypothetical protein